MKHNRAIRTWARFTLAAATSLALAACATVPGGKVSEEERASIDASLRSDIAILASEEFAGRRPGTIGETKTLDFIQGSLQRSGFVSGTNDPANPWRAPVPLINTVSIDSRVSVTSGKRTVMLPDAGTFAFTSASLGLIENGAMIYVGRLGESVPDDTVMGKVVVMLGEPGKSPPRRKALFEKGASAIFTIVDDHSSVDQIRAFRSRDTFSLADEVTDSLNVFASHDVMKTALGGERWEELLELAEAEDFAPIELKATANVEARTKRREVTSHNLIGRLPGSIPSSGSVLLLAHWDHFGECGKDGDEDRLCNGAADNASGVAMMLELARRLSATGPHDRDIYVMGTTAEEWGLLGAKRFAQVPPVPLDQFVAALNFDTVTIAPRGSPVAFVGEGETPLDAIVLDTVADLRMDLGDRILAEQYLRRQDSWALLEAGVPAVVLTSSFGSDEALNKYLSERYHKAADDIDGLETGAAIDDLILNQLLLKRLASTADYPASAE